MRIQVRGTGWSGLPRTLAVLGVLVGVFLMHGLTGNHDVTMAGPQLGAAPAAASAGHSMAALDQPIISVDEHQHMDGACLAMLTALIVLLALQLALRSLLVRRLIQPAVRAERPVLTGRSPPWTTPSLSKLCVLRT